MTNDVWQQACATLTFALATTLCGGCSILFHADSNQCSSTADCRARGGAFSSLVCNAGTCVEPEAGLEAGPGTDAGTDGAAEAAGLTCSTWMDCTAIASPTHPEVACDPQSHACIQLTTDDCPYVIPTGAWQPTATNGTNGLNPTFIGAFATLPPSGPTSHPSFLNYQLALEQFEQVGGIPGPDGAALQNPAAVICSDEAADPDAVMDHLVNDVHVPAVVAALPSTTLRTTFSHVDPGGGQTTPTVFFMNPFAADSTLTSLGTNNLLWHMLGQPGDTAPAYAAFFPRVEAYVRSSIYQARAGQGLPADGGIGPSAPLRVAGVTAAATSTQDLAKAVKNVLTWDGESVAQHQQDTPPTYQDVLINGSTLNGTDLTQIDVSGAVTQILQFLPNVIVSFASEEFITLFEALENQWPKNTPLPFYLIGPYNSDSTNLTGWIATYNATRWRMAGVTFASTTDTTVLSAYTTQFLTRYPDGQQALGQENYYDAMYFTVYSLVGAGRGTVTGGDVGEGMKRLVDPSGTYTYDEGPGSDIGNVIQQITMTNDNITLIGALGPPDFNTTTGSRISQGDVFCIGLVPPPPQASIQYFFDALRLAGGGASDGGASDDGGNEALVGSFPSQCYGGAGP